MWTTGCSHSTALSIVLSEIIENDFLDPPLLLPIEKITC